MTDVEETSAAPSLQEAVPPQTKLPTSASLEASEKVESGDALMHVDIAVALEETAVPDVNAPAPPKTDAALSPVDALQVASIATEAAQTVADEAAQAATDALSSVEVADMAILSSVGPMAAVESSTPASTAADVREEVLAALQLEDVALSAAAAVDDQDQLAELAAEPEDWLSTPGTGVSATLETEQEALTQEFEVAAATPPALFVKSLKINITLYAYRFCFPPVCGLFFSLSLHIACHIHAVSGLCRTSRPSLATPPVRTRRTWASFR